MFLASAAVVAFVPPFATGKVPVTPGVTFLLPSNDAVDVLPRLVLIVLAVSSFSADVAEPPTVDEPAYLCV